MTAEVRFLNPATIARATGYSHIAEVSNGRMIFIAGQIALDTNGNVVGLGDMRAQAEQVFQNIQAALEAVGATFQHVVKLSYYMTDISQIAAVREVRDRYINTAQPPVSTAVEVRRLFREEFMIEVEAVAVVP